MAKRGRPKTIYDHRRDPWEMENGEFHAVNGKDYRTAPMPSDADIDAVMARIRGTGKRLTQGTE